MRIAVARAVSIIGHPLVLLPVAALTAASGHGASSRRLWFLGAAMLLLGICVLAFSWLQVRSGRWAHVDASIRTERKSLNVFLGALCLASAALLWLTTREPHMSMGLVLSGALVFMALAISRWVKLSLHVAFAAFATALLWPRVPALLVGAVVTAVVAWSRLVLGRHVAADVGAALLLGTSTGCAFQLWAV